MDAHHRIDPQTREALALFSAAIEDRFDIRQLILFESRARATHRTDSDVDVAVLLGAHSPHSFDMLMELADAAFDVMLETDVLITPLPISLEEWEHPGEFNNPALLENIRREGVPV